jgi:hypothetical protein
MKLLRLAGCDQLQGSGSASRCRLRQLLNYVRSDSADLLLRQRFQLVAKTGNGQGAVIGAPSVFGGGAEL